MNNNTNAQKSRRDQANKSVSRDQENTYLLFDKANNCIKKITVNRKHGFTPDNDWMKAIAPNAVRYQIADK